ncbi:hypothetical protein SDC9_54907 [bioreactor metagenome]|uniref:Uncharacterized protein n=1 Tax=bioreactor metagenome TaxID=1076179 RepID=A0A644X2S2_9ZZZZ
MIDYIIAYLSSSPLPIKIKIKDMAFAYVFYSGLGEIIFGSGDYTFSVLFIPNDMILFQLLNIFIRYFLTLH